MQKLRNRWPKLWLTLWQRNGQSLTIFVPVLALAVILVIAGLVWALAYQSPYGAVVGLALAIGTLAVGGQY